MLAVLTFLSTTVVYGSRATDCPCVSPPSCRTIPYGSHVLDIATFGILPACPVLGNVRCCPRDVLEKENTDAFALVDSTIHDDGIKVNDNIVASHSKPQKMLGKRDTDEDKLPCVPGLMCAKLYGFHPLDVARFGALPHCSRRGIVRCVELKAPSTGHLFTQEEGHDNAHILPCVPIYECNKIYGFDPLDIAKFGALTHCAPLGFVRCVQVKDSTTGSTPNSSPSLIISDVQTQSQVPSVISSDVQAQLSLASPSVISSDVQAQSSSTSPSVISSDVQAQSSLTSQSAISSDVQAQSSSTSLSIISSDVQAQSSSTSPSVILLDVQAQSSSTSPSVILSDVQAQSSATSPSVISSDVQAQSSLTSPSVISSDVQAQSSLTFPSVISSDVQAQLSLASPSAISSDVQAQSSLTSPSAISSDVQSQSSSISPSVISSDVQAQSSSTSPSVIASDVQAQLSLASPSVISSDVQAQSSLTSPSVISSDVQAQSSSTSPSVFSSDVQALLSLASPSVISSDVQSQSSSTSPSSISSHVQAQLSLASPYVIISDVQDQSPSGSLALISDMQVQSSSAVNYETDENGNQDFSSSDIQDVEEHGIENSNNDERAAAVHLKPVKVSMADVLGDNKVTEYTPIAIDGNNMISEGVNLHMHIPTELIGTDFYRMIKYFLALRLNSNALPVSTEIGQKSDQDSIKDLDNTKVIKSNNPIKNVKVQDSSELVKPNLEDQSSPDKLKNGERLALSNIIKSNFMNDQSYLNKMDRVKDPEIINTVSSENGDYLNNIEDGENRNNHIESDVKDVGKLLKPDHVKDDKNQIKRDNFNDGINDAKSEKIKRPYPDKSENVEHSDSDVKDDNKFIIRDSSEDFWFLSKI